MRALRKIKSSPASWTLTEFLKSSDWFGKLSEEEQAWVASRMSERRVGKGEHLAPEGQVATHGYTVLDGLLIWSVSNAEGDEITLGALLGGSWFGHATLSAQDPRQGYVVALRESTVACMPKDVFDWLMSRSVPFNNFLLRHMFARTRWLMGSIAARATQSVEQQVARTILGIIDPEQNPHAGLEINVSQEELGRVAGYSRQRCCAAVNKLRAEGLVTASYCDLVISDVARLRDYATGKSARTLKPSPRHSILA